MSTPDEYRVGEMVRIIRLHDDAMRAPLETIELYRKVLGRPLHIAETVRYGSDYCLGFNVNDDGSQGDESSRDMIWVKAEEVRRVLD